MADITYIPTREGWLYLAAVEDLYSRRVVGWSMADHMESRLVVDALEMSVQRRLPGEGLLAHSDRGSQYASEHYQLLLAKHEAVAGPEVFPKCVNRKTNQHASSCSPSRHRIAAALMGSKRSLAGLALFG